MRKGEPLRGSYCFFPEMLSEDDECGPGWGKDPAEILARTCEGTPPTSWRNTGSWSKLFRTCKPLPPSSSWSGFSGWNGIFPLGTSVPEISLKRSAACDNSVSDKTAFYTQSLGDLWFRRLFRSPAFGESRLLEGQGALLVCGDHSCPPQDMVACVGSAAPCLRAWGEVLVRAVGLPTRLFIISLSYCWVTRAPWVLAGWHPWNIFLTWIAKEITKIWNG